MDHGNQPKRLPVVMVVDDEDEVRGYMRYVMKTAGYTVISARNSMEALQKAAIFLDTIDILLTDIHMKAYQNGIALASCFGTLHPETRIILTSGSPLPEVVFGPIRFLPFLPKPFTPGQLLAAARGEPVLSNSQTNDSWVPS